MKIALGAGEGEVHLFLDEKGREELIKCLKELEFPTAASHDHFHLFTEEWGSHGLAVLNSGTTKRLGLEPVHHLKVYMRPPDEDMW